MQVGYGNPTVNATQ